ncbi:MAG: hypothetical protein LAO05_02945 [Acidobacteriia bacterium]|nr:hypothetical protein [Terriglobia bacterium]
MTARTGVAVGPAVSGRGPMRERVLAIALAPAFAGLAAVLVGVGALPVEEACTAALAVLLAFLPSGWLAPGGWRRRAAESLLLPAAFALVIVGDPTLRRMVLPPLLAVAALGACAAALGRVSDRGRTIACVALGLAVRSATGLGLLGHPPARTVLAVVTVTLLAAAGTRALGARGGMLAALLAGCAPLERAPVAAVLLLAAAAAAVATFVTLPAARERVARGWEPAALAVGVVAAALAPWGGIAVGSGWPAAGLSVVGAGMVALVATPLLPAGVAGAAWLGVASLLGPIGLPPPDRPGFALTAASPEAELPASEGGVYVIETSIANAADVPQGTVVATVAGDTWTIPIRAGDGTAEWAHERTDVRTAAAHSLPAAVAWRPSGSGGDAFWGVAGRISREVPQGTRPRIVRANGLAPRVAVNVATAGDSRPTPPRDWPASAWVLATAVAVAVLQLVSGTWGTPSAGVPWALLAALAVAGRTAVAPLALLAERHGVDLCLAALLAAWLPAAAAWLRRRRTFATAAALLVPLALATPHLTPPLYGDEPYHLIVLDSLAHDHDLDLTNNFDLEHHPYNRIYLGQFKHPPVLAMLLLPGYLFAGRSGALVLLALGGAALTALVARRAQALGCPPSRVRLLVAALLLTHPLATFSTQIWVEVPGALAAIVCAVLLALPTPRRGMIAVLTGLMTAVKTRLAFVTLPLAVLAWRPRRWRAREVRNALVAVGGAVAVGFGVSWATFGHPLGYYRLLTFVPSSVTQPLVALGGLVFDPAGGLAFSAPMLLVALAGVGRLWRRGGQGERALLAGGGVTVLALLHSPEWYGGGSPPGRYLVPLLPAFALAGAAVLAAGVRWRPLASALVPPSILLWWTLVTRPHLSVNPGDGGWWLADALAQRFAADARHLVPSFLRIAPMTFIGPVVVTIAAAAAVWWAHRRSGFARAVARACASMWLLAAAAAVLALALRTDRVVEIEDPQVVKAGGTLVPPPGTFSRFDYPNGWRLENGDGVEVPLNLPHAARLRLEGWLEGAAAAGAEIVASWDGGPAARVVMSGAGPGTVPIPAPASSGRHRLRLALSSPSGGAAVLDRLTVAQ